VMLQYLSEFAAAGARVRVAARVTHRTVIVDRKIVFVGVVADSLGLPMLLVREPALVRNFCSEFAALWRSSHSVGVGPEDSLADESVREILAMLGSGVTDDVAAKQLGISPRTVRRRVAAVLDLLGASSRFEAGAKAVQAGWL
jgi:DNA-binding CsgD family transcriptional regulator